MSTYLLYIYIAGILGFGTHEAYQCEPGRAVSVGECRTMAFVTAPLWPVGVVAYAVMMP